MVFGGTGADTLLFTSSVVNNSINAGSGNDSIVMSGTGMSGNNIDLGVGTDTLKFTTATNEDTVTVTSTTISGAKSITTKQQSLVLPLLLVQVPTLSSSRMVWVSVLKSSPTLVTIRSSS